jgi:D-arginine dehydrogenase
MLSHLNRVEPALPEHVDIIVVGAGIAGASVAARLATAGRRVVLLEMEAQPGHHTTGRSAAVFAPSYGPAPIRALTRASEAFFTEPPAAFTNAALFSPRLIMMIARADQRESLSTLHEAVCASGDTEVIDGAALHKVNPLVKSSYAAAAMLDKAGQDIDVGALHQGFLTQFKRAAGELRTKAAVRAISRAGDWMVDTAAGQFIAPLVVNAAGAWADELGAMAGAEPIGLVPKRRTAALVRVPQAATAAHGDSRIAELPITIDVDEQFYLKPDAGRLLVSPADETPSSPCDAQPEELDIALCVDRIETAFDLQIDRIENKWAGLRSFVKDKSPVAGFSAEAEGFYWLAGQGGYGIQTSPALSDFAAAQILRQPLPAYIVDQGLQADSLAPARLIDNDTASQN